MNEHGVPGTHEEAAAILRSVGGLFDDLKALYGKVLLHTDADGDWCIHLGEFAPNDHDTAEDIGNGCSEGTWAETIMHAVGHAKEDVAAQRTDRQEQAKNN